MPDQRVLTQIKKTREFLAALRNRRNAKILADAPPPVISNAGQLASATRLGLLRKPVLSGRAVTAKTPLGKPGLDDLLGGVSRPIAPMYPPRPPFQPDTERARINARFRSLSPEEQQAQYGGTEQPISGLGDFMERRVLQPLAKKYPIQRANVKALADIGSALMPSTKPFQDMTTGEKVLTLGLDIAVSIPWGSVLSKGGRAVIKQSAQTEAMNAYNATFGKSLDAMIARRARGMPADQFNRFQNLVYDAVAANKPSVQAKATERMLYRMGRTPNATQAARRAAEETVSHIETQLIPTFTPGGSAVPGQTRPLAEVMAGAEMKLGKPTPESVAAKIIAGQKLTVADANLSVKEADKLQRLVDAARSGQQMAASTSVQTGLPGIGKSEAQSQLFGEVSGKESRRAPLIEVPQQAKPLKGQRPIPESQADYEAMAEAEGLRETLAQDPVAQYRFKVGKSNFGLDSLISIREQDFPQYLTVKQAQALRPYSDWSHYTQKGTKDFNHIPKELVLDTIAQELGYDYTGGIDDLANRVVQIRQEKAQIARLSRAVVSELPGRKGAEATPAVEGATQVQLPSGTTANIVETDPGRIWEIEVRGERAGALIDNFGSITVFGGGTSFKVKTKAEGFRKLQELAIEQERGILRRPRIIPQAEAVATAPEQVVKAEPVLPKGRTVTARAQAQNIPVAAVSQGVPPVKTPPPAKPPVSAGGTGGGQPPPPTANDLPPSITPGPMASNIIGLRTIEPGLVRSELLGNIIKRTISKGLVKAGIQPFVEADRLANPAMRERFRVKTAIESQSALIGAKSEQVVKKAFIFDKQGRIPALKGINPDISGAPTIQDVAARLPTFEASLTDSQKTALATLRGMVEPYHNLMTEVGIEIPQRPDVMDGGFYLPRGRAALEGADAPVKIRAGLGKGTKKGFERPAYFASQSEGILKGYEYAPLGDALSAYSFDAGVRATDAHVVNYFKALTDETGALIGETAKMRLLRQSPELVQKMEALKGQLDKLKRLSGALTERQMEVIDLWQHDPEFDDLDTLLNGLATMRGGNKPGYTGSELALALKEAKESIRSLRPEYKVALRRAQITPREQGTIGLPGLQGRTYPDEIANAANIVLSQEGRTTGALAPAVNVANAFNNLYRGLRATLDDSALGIQGLLGIGAQPRAYKEALKVNIRAWGAGGDKILGKFIEDFDAKTAATGRLSSSDWAKAELHLGGVASEFQLGQGFSSKLANLPAVRQANRAFGFFGDALRLDWADGELATQLRKHTLEELQAKGDLERIANAANNMTGWAKGKAFGSVGDLLLFAPRFLQSRLETVAKAGVGLRPNATIDQKMTRNALLRLIGWGTLLTIAVNEMLDNDTDFRPIVDGKRNSNFMRINYQGRKYTVFGTWDSLLGMIINVGTGRPLNAVRSMSSGMVTGAWDVLTGRDYNYNAVRDTPANFAKWLIGSFVPFAAQDIPSMAQGVAQGLKTGEAEKVIGGGIGIGTQLVGVKSYEVSPTYELKVKWAGDFKTYNDIPTKFKTSPLAEVIAERKQFPDTRERYLLKNPDVAAKLFITGQISSLRTIPQIDKAVELMKTNNLTMADIPGLVVTPETAKYESESHKAMRLYFEKQFGMAAPAKSAPSPATPPVIPRTTIPATPTTTPVPGSVEYFRQRRQELAGATR